MTTIRTLLAALLLSLTPTLAHAQGAIFSAGAWTNNYSGTLTGTGTTATDGPVLAGEFLTGTGWTSTGWTGAWATGWIHTTGNASVLSYPTSVTVGASYQIAYTITGRTAGSITIALGGQSLDGVTATGAFGPKATTTSGLTVTPTTDFDGTVILSVKAITGASAATISLKDSTGTVRVEVRANAASSMAAFGAGALANNTTGSSNSAVGVNALTNNTTGSYGSAVGVSALYRNTTGSSNSAVGISALYSNTAGNSNSAVGVSALYSNTTGSYSSAVGLNALYSNTTGSYNSAVGYDSGRFIADGVTANAAATSSVYLGKAVRALAASGDHETVVGADAIGHGSNTVTLGSSANVGVWAGTVPMLRETAVPATATTACILGDVAVDASYAYFCVAANTWRRVAVVAW